MKDRLKAASFKTRVASALAALGIIAAVGWKFESFGLQILVGLLIALMLREYLRLSLLPQQAGMTLILWNLICSLGLFGAVLVSAEPLLMVTVCISAYLTIALWLTRNRMTNERLLPALSTSVLGFFVCVVFPAYEIHTLRLPNGMAWFALHLSIVFAGDVGAYFGGIRWGKEKLMPQISPNKTVAGALSGLVASMGAGLTIATIGLPHARWWYVIVFALICGFAAQMGDLLLSLIKRVADVKDSGTIMPGHGGVLDRLDGVIVTCPLIYTFALAVETYL